MSKFIKKLKEDLLYEDELEIANLPDTACPMIKVEGYDEEETEKLDFENSAVVNILPNEMTIVAGGDWQQPTMFTVYLGEDENLLYKDVVVGIDFGKIKFLDDEEILSRLNQFS